jgi:hypothetical protein
MGGDKQMAQEISISTASEIMLNFARMTGLSAAGEPPRRYLWTDAFAVCNFLELYRRTLDENYKRLAIDLVDQVHRVLGRHRDDNRRKGWISGLSYAEGLRHPTQGGLRIGKKLPEQKKGVTSDERLEWDSDGQYYHYLTKWMHALSCTGLATGNEVYDRWAVELAKAAHAGFTYELSPGIPKRMYWKMNIDLTYPLVRSMGQHDPLNGLITFLELKARTDKSGLKDQIPDLSPEIYELKAMCSEIDLITEDTLGIGELLSDAFRLGQLIAHTGIDMNGLLINMLDSALAGLNAFIRQNTLGYPAEYRLAFRELGLSIGLDAVIRLKSLIAENMELLKSDKNGKLIEALISHTPLIEAIESFWLEPSHQKSRTFADHLDINMVMLASSLIPDGYLRIF